MEAVVALVEHVCRHWLAGEQGTVVTGYGIRMHLQQFYFHSSMYEQGTVNLQVYTDENDSISAVLTIKWLMTYTYSSIVYMYVYV